MKKLAIIDADGIPYIIGWNNRLTESKAVVRKNVDSFIEDILNEVKADEYIGLIESKSELPCFRHSIAKDKPYKGNRKEKPEWYKKWISVIHERMENKWGFQRSHGGVETDDVVASLFKYYQQKPDIDVTLCGNDKDLYQMPGKHFNFKDKVHRFYNPTQAQYWLFMQVLMGDSTDNIPGLKGCGEKGAENALKIDGVDKENYHIAAYYAFTEKLGLDKGTQSFYENYMLCKMRDELDVSEYKLTSFNSDLFTEFDEPEEDDEEIIRDSGDELFTIGNGLP